MQFSLIILFILAQIAATMAGLTQTLGLNIFIAVILTFIISVISFFIPLVGSVVAIWGACTAWELEPLIAIILYFSFPIILMLFSPKKD